MSANSAQINARPVWLIIGLSIAPAIGLGICRFAYALVLPGMRDSLDWSELPVERALARPHLLILPTNGRHLEF
jgi:hypothetical protein